MPPQRVGGQDHVRRGRPGRRRAPSNGTKHTVTLGPNPAFSLKALQVGVRRHRGQLGARATRYLRVNNKHYKIVCSPAHRLSQTLFEPRPRVVAHDDRTTGILLLRHPTTLACNPVADHHFHKSPIRRSFRPANVRTVRASRSPSRSRQKASTSAYRLVHRDHRLPPCQGVELCRRANHQGHVDRPKERWICLWRDWPCGLRDHSCQELANRPAPPRNRRCRLTRTHRSASWR